MNAIFPERNALLRPNITAEGQFAFAGYLWEKWLKAPSNTKLLKQIGVHIMVGLSLLIPLIYKIAYVALNAINGKLLPPPTPLQPDLPADSHRNLHSDLLSGLSSQSPQIQVSSPTLPPREVVPVTFADLPLSFLEEITMQLESDEIGLFAQVSQQTALAARAPQVWDMWATKFSFQFDRLEVRAVMMPLLRFFIINEGNEVWLRRSDTEESIQQALAAFPAACWIMQTGTRARTFHFSFRSPSGEITLYRDVALGCRASLRYDTVSRIISSDLYRQIKG